MKVDLSDEELVRLAKQGDPNAFEALMMRYQKKVFSVAYGLIHDTQEAEDLTQECFIRAYSGLGGFQESAGFYTWIYRITVNLCMDHFRKQSAQRAAVTDEPVQDQENCELNQVTPEAIASRREIQQAVQNAIQGLPLDQRTAIVLRELEGLSYKEIAEVVNTSIGTVMSRIFYARKRLRQLLKSYFHGVDHE